MSLSHASLCDTSVNTNILYALLTDKPFKIFAKYVIIQTKAIERKIPPKIRTNYLPFSCGIRAMHFSAASFEGA